jgi:hypothetical protein
VNVRPLGNNLWTGNGSPEGKVDLPPNVLFIDALSGVQYRKVTAAGVKTGWIYPIGFAVAVSGPQGPAGGPQGDQGATGSQGSQGDAGTQGTSGPQGDTGSQGSIGSQGSSGAQGATGSAGAQGNQGDIGTTGTQGASGAQGATGAQGDQGTTGSTGGTGPQGAQGASGAAGAQGAQGASGGTGSQGPQGFQGAVGGAGTQGNQGAQGGTGTTGTQGTQGFQGNQGNQGAVGAQGAQGFQGTQGTQGFQGTQGNQGVFGGNSLGYTFDSTITDGDPGSGKLRFNNATIGSVTAIFIDDLDENAVDQQAWINAIDDSTNTVRGMVRVGKQTNSGVFAIWNVTGGNTDPGGYTKLALTFVSSDGAFANNDKIFISFERSGDVGSQGTQGTQGVQGTQGFQGFQGTQGTQGFQGTQGTQGVVGAGNTTLFSVQGNQTTCAAQTITDIFAGISVAASTTYQYEAHIGMQAAAGIQGVQMGIQCSAVGATVMGIVRGFQAATDDKSVIQTAQGVVAAAPMQMTVGPQSITLSGIIITPSGSNTVGVQAKGVQASQAWFVKANAFLKLTKTS